MKLFQRLGPYGLGLLMAAYVGILAWAVSRVPQSKWGSRDCPVVGDRACKGKR